MNDFDRLLAERIQNTPPWTDDDEDSEKDIAFNRGSDARIHGETLRSNPFLASHNPSLHKAWRAGWIDAHKWWGKHARPGTFRPLPEVAV